MFERSAVIPVSKLVRLSGSVTLPQNLTIELAVLSLRVLASPSYVA
jgi:hypothetical protein